MKNSTITNIPLQVHSDIEWQQIIRNTILQPQQLNK